MLELAVAAFRGDETPSIVLQHPQYLTDFHQASISGLRPFCARSPLVLHNARGERPRRANASRRSARLRSYGPHQACLRLLRP